MTDIPGNSSTTASVTVGSTTHGSLEVAGDHDWYKLELNAGQTVTIFLKSAESNGLEDPCLRLLNSSGTLLVENDDGAGGYDSRITFTATSSGTYYVEAGSYDDLDDGEFELTVSNYTPPPVGSMDDIADQLVSGYWGGYSYRFDVTQGDSITVNLTALASDGRLLAREALSQWSDIIGVSFVEVSSGGQITFDDNEPDAWAEFETWGNFITSAHVNISTQWLQDFGNEIGSYGYQSYIHEVGHALGLGHAGNYDGDAVFDNDALFQMDGWAASVMSYFAQDESSYWSDLGFSFGYLATPMIADIIAMQQLYGLSTTTRSGNDGYGTYGSDISNPNQYPDVAATIFDTGGIDSLHYVAVTADQRIDLNPGTFSNVGGGVGNLAIAPGTIIENATGGSGNDVLVGNHVDNRLQGGAGDDRLLGGDGNDTASYDEASGVTVDLSLTTAQNTGSAGIDTLSGIENLIGSSGDDLLIGTSGANVIEGRGGSDDIRGGGGNDILSGDIYGAVTLRGGDGNDILSGHGTIDGGSGFDTLTFEGYGWLNVRVDLGVTTAQDILAQYGGLLSTILSIEHVIGTDDYDFLTGGNADETLEGRGGWDTLRGSAGNDWLIGGEGFDILDGGSGVDVMEGGIGDDEYVVDVSSDTIVENVGEGLDQVSATVSYVLASNVENLSLTGSQAIEGAGNALANVITGNAGSNLLQGHAGDDHLRGGAGNDTLNGGSGADTLDGGLGNDSFYVDAGDVVVERAGEGTDAVFAATSYVLSQNIENLTLTGDGASSGTGNSLANTIIGNDARNFINGAAGADQMIGGAGNDTYVVDNAGDVPVEYVGDGVDTVRSTIGYTLGNHLENLVLTGAASISGTGNALANTILGNSANNFLNGAGGQDSMRGGAGNDTYVVDDGEDVVVELPGAGIDTVRSYVTYRLGSTVENLVMLGTAAVGTGNDLNNIILGSDSNNFINGDSGGDSLRGGGGNDTYVVDDSGDVIIELTDAGTDTVRSYFDYRIGSNVENMVLLGTAVVGTGNSASNIIIGTEGTNFLNGDGGADSLRGGAGNDTYVLDHSGDSVVETFGAGTDTVRTYVDHTLQVNVENMVLIGNAEIDGNGNGLNNTILGNDLANTIRGMGGNDSLRGMGGDDTLIGGAGNDGLLGGSGGDDFVFDAALSATTNVDEIRDFTSSEGDDIVLDQSVFANLALGTLSASAFHTGTAAADADDRIVYDSATGRIYYDADGSGAGEQTLFATVSAGTSLTNADFFVIA